MTSQNHILVLHTSCIRRDEEQDDEDVGGSNNNTNTDAMMELLTSLPITCDMLLLPEIPSSHGDASVDWMELAQNPLNPCGLSNVLLMENLPWKQVLLSLTSCAMTYDTSNGIRHRLSIDPMPSTFDFAIEGNEGLSSSSSSTTTNLFLEFDVSQAHQVLQELLLEGSGPEREQDDPLLLRVDTLEEALVPKLDDGSLSLTVQDADDSLPGIIEHDDIVAATKATTTTATSRSNARPKLVNGSVAPSEEPLVSKESFDGMHAKLRQAQKDPFTRLPSLEDPPSSRLDKELLALQRVQDILQQDSANLDRLIQVLGMVGLGLLGLLIWSGYQLYRAKQEDNRTLQLRKLVERKIMVQSALSVARPYVVARNYHVEMARRAAAAMPDSQPAAATGIHSSTPTHTFGTPRTDNRSRSRSLAPRLPITPTRLDFSVECSRLAAESDKLVPNCNAVPALTRVKCDTTSSHIVNPPSPPVFANPFAKTTTTTMINVAGQSKDTPTTASSDGSSSTKDVTLSPCSRLVQSWEARKTARRRNRKQQQPSKVALFPPSSSVPAPNFTTSDATTVGSAHFLTPVPAVPLLFPSSDPTTTGLLPAGGSKGVAGTEKLIFPSVVNTSQKNPFASSSSSNSSGHQPGLQGGISNPTTLVQSEAAPPIPKLVCSSPDSSDSFVDDYW